LNCPFGEKCKFTHDIRKYLKDGKREDLSTFNGVCPVWQAKGKCGHGWSCRFAGSHSQEVEHEDGRKELMLLTNDEFYANGITATTHEQEDAGIGVANVVSVGDKITLRKKKFPTTKSDEYLKWLDHRVKEEKKKATDDVDDDGILITNGTHDNRAQYTEPPFKPSEKRRIYYGPETPVLAPLTTQSNLPFRRLCVSLGAQVTWSEMAMGLPLLQGEKQEWALMKAHESELSPPKYSPKSIVADYDNTKDLKFGAQIAANKPWLALKTTEVLTTLCPHLRAVDLNCGCPIDLVFRQGAGSALLDAQAKMEKILRGMNAVSGSVPITVKIRMGTKDKQPTAEKLCRRLALGGEEAQEANDGPAGVAAITLHGRSRQQRYTRSADWEYIASCATLVSQLKAERAEITDTVREPDARDLSASTTGSGLPYFIGNGDILSHRDYTTHLAHSGVDSCMIARGALIKPWIFEEIATDQYLDKSASERLGYVEQFVRNGLEYWGSDEVGVGTTRRFLLEWLSFSCRYVPIGILEHLPPKFGDRPPAFRGRNELETLLSSANYRDWMKIR
jgi:tRNA-dihydrouridine synthase 3